MEEEKKKQQPSIPMKATWEAMHGQLGSPSWAPPLTTFETDAIARPGYNDHNTASEFNDQGDVLREKVCLLAEMIKRSENCCAYTGAGISTSSGIGDYASKGESHSTATKPKSNYDAQPTLSHCVLSSLNREGFLKHWVQQNHDGLPQKAGYPQKDLNEIHGAWYDPSNPVVMMSGQLRSDLFSLLLEWEEKADLLLVLGTSLSGMNADRMVTSCAKRARKERKKGEEGKGLAGPVIVSLQKTPKDSVCSLRIFSTIDKVMELLAEEMRLSTTPLVQKGEVREGEEEEDVFWVPYNEKGDRVEGGEKIKLDLREDQVVKITRGQFEGDRGVVMGKHDEGHYRIQFRHNIGRGGKRFMAPMLRTMGWWWVEEARRGDLEWIPVVNDVVK